jgi:alpha-glucosidase
MFSEPKSYTSSIHHDGSARYVKKIGGGEISPGDEVIVRLRASLEAPIERVLVRTAPDGEQQFTEMLSGDSDPACRWWQGVLKVSMPVFNYRFLIIARDGAWWYNAGGLQRGTPTDGEDFRILAGYEAPAWVRESVFYQIFPDRFSDGEPENNVREAEFTYWGEPSRTRRWGEPLSSGRAAMVEFYGGDLQGIEKRLDYLQELGVNALYLNPIFPAYSNHRYDVTDYYKVDPHLGGEHALISLRQATRRREMRIILDIVPNHCGYLHPWFQRALANLDAPEAEFFTFRRYPDEFESWLGVKSLPKLNYQSERLRQVMYAGPESIFRTWLKPPYEMDGWRLDVANMLGRQGPEQLGMEVGRGIRQAIREENRHAYILGENFFDGSPQLQGDCWDGVMNYSGFAKPLWYWLGGFYVRQHGQPAYVTSPEPWSTEALVSTWQNFSAVIPWVIASQQYNLLGSHDTERILSVVKGDGRLNRLAAGILMTSVGVPGIYYGDEVGMGVGKYALARACMPWDRSEWDEDLLDFYKTLIQLRRTSPALIEGGMQVLATADNSLAYQREAGGERIVVIAHRGPEELEASSLQVAHGAIPDGSVFQELFSGRRTIIENGRMAFAAMPPGVQIWRSLS